MANVIRQDIVQVMFDTNLEEIKKLTKEIDDLKKKFTGGVGDDEFEKMKRSANETVKPLEKVKNKIKDITSKTTELGKKAATTAFNGLKKLASISFKTLAVGITGAATAIGFLVKNSVTAYAEYEQLYGGMQTLLGAKGAKNVEEYAKITGKSVKAVQDEYKKLVESEKLVMKNANDAFKNAGMSANQYMSTITSFSAALTSSLGGDTAEAAKLADVAIKDMADNANKMGTPLESVSIVYSNLARGMFMTLDNLKLGYAGTKDGAMQMVNDAAKIDKSVKANDISYANLVKAIHAVQKKMDIYGTTQKEAFKTITGSMNTFKAAWGNLLPAMVQGGDELDQCITNLVDSIVGFETETGELEGGIINNLMPAVEKALGGVGTLIEKLSPTIEAELPKLIDALLPPLITAATALFAGLLKSLPQIVKTIAKEIPDILKQLGQAISDTFGEQFPVLKKFGNFFVENAGKVAKFVPVILGLVAAFKIFNKIKAISGIFGKSGGEGKTGGLFDGLAKMKTTSVLKGMANLAIIIGGFTVLAVALMAVAPHIAKLSDAKSIVELTVIMGTLGALGTVLAQFAGIVGKIPVATVAKGLANMAIVLVGFGALAAAFAWVAPFIAKLSDMKSILKLVAIMGILGVLGTALTVFAGIAGIIPIPLVLAGLANMALVLGGVTGIIVAFGKLSQIDGFNEFIKTGGETLATLFNAIGKIGGSLIGGLGEGLSNSLPTIGENLAAFATSLKPMFTMFEGADLTAIGNFFKGLGSFMLQMAGEGILSIFTGGTDFAELGTGLNTFATNSKGFFTQVAELPENGFTNATKLFECLAGMKSLPKKGGVKGWFNGEIDYSKISAGLAILAGAAPVHFFNTVATLKQEGFDNATKLFECLAGMKSLPKEGGVVGWFSGNIDYSKISAGLGSLASEGVKNFFTMVGGLAPQSFENTKLLFESLASIKKLPKEGGWWDKVTGEETSTLSSIADELGGFGEKTEAFFKQVNALNLNKLNGLWSSLQKAGKLTTENLSVVIDESISTLVAKISGLPQKMGDALKNNSKGLSEGMVSMWKAAVKSSVAPVNKLLEGANHILKEFGSKKRVITWTPYARGTDGHKGGNALVNDGNGAELVQMPNGHTFIPRGRNVLIPNAPKGMKVLPAGSTARLMGRTSPTFKYADGTGNFDVWSYIDNASGLVSKISEGISYNGMSAFASNVGKGMVSTFKGEMSAWIEKLFEEEGALSLADYVASKGVSQWKSTVIRALKMEGQYSAANVARTLYQMQTESGGNPRAINLWDSNAKKGIPSKGLMQVIDPTFKAYAREGFNKNIYDPLSNILASVRYATSRYGSLAKAYQGHGYSKGIGTVTMPSQSRSVNVSYTPESSYTGGRANITENNTYSPVFNLTISGTSDDRATERKVKKWIREAWEEMLSTCDSKNPQTQEV